MATTEQRPASAENAPAASQTPLPKDDLLAVLQSQPADSSYEELLRELHARWSLRRGLADADAGRTTDHAEVKAIVESWSK